MMLTDRLLTFDHLPLGSTAPPGDGRTSSDWQRGSRTLDDGTVIRDTTVVVESRSRPGRRSCRVTHHAGVDPINSSGERCEFADFRDPASRERYGTEGWYGTAFYLDTFMPPSSWGIVAQLHHAGGTGSPPFALRVDRWGSDPGGVAGHMYLAYRDTPSGRDLYRLVEPDVPVKTPVRVIWHIRWGGTAGSSYPGLVEMWTRIGGQQAWTQQHPDGGWVGTTIFQESQPSYWKGAWYSGAAQSVTIEHDGIIRASSRAAIEQWFGDPATSPPPDPDPHVDMEAIAGDMDAVGTTLGATVTALEEAIRDVQASVLMVRASAQRLRQ